MVLIIFKKILKFKTFNEFLKNYKKLLLNLLDIQKTILLLYKMLYYLNDILMLEIKLLLKVKILKLYVYKKTIYLS